MKGDGVTRKKYNHGSSQSSNKRRESSAPFGAYYDVETHKWRCKRCRLSLSNCNCQSGSQREITGRDGQ